MRTPNRCHNIVAISLLNNILPKIISNHKSQKPVSTSRLHTSVL